MLVRVWLPDRPGALGLVASRIGAMRGDIVGIDVVERSGDVAVDEFAVVLPDLDLLTLLIREVEEVDEASVEEVRVVERFADPWLDALESAAGLCEATDVAALMTRLVAHTRRDFLADWAAVAHHGAIIESVGDGVPSAEHLGTLVASTAGASTSGASAASGVSVASASGDGETGPGDVVVVPMDGQNARLFAGRAGRPFRPRERAQLLAITRIAGRAWSLLAPDAG